MANNTKDNDKIVIGNWKMNLNVQESSLYLNKLANLIQTHRDVKVILAPSMIALQTLSLQVNYHEFKLAAQNFYWRDEGAFTGEVSATQLRGLVQYALIGHSERRHVFAESDKDIRNKVQAALRNGIKPILCVGETEWERNEGETEDIVRDQLVSGLANVTSEDLGDIMIAYEPVSAIGTGDNSMPSDAEAVIVSIRKTIKRLFGAKAGDDIKVLYGGSVTSATAGGYLLKPNIDGVLVGGASLESNQFNEIVEQAYEATR